MYNFKQIPLIISLLLVLSCNYSTQTRYNYSEVGKIQVVEFGTVVAVRDIDIVGENSGISAALGGVGGAVGGASTGNGVGGVGAGVAGAIGGAVVGYTLEQAIRNRGGVEYTVVLKNGKTLTIAQNVSQKDTILKVGDRVMVQINGQYQRVLPANSLPEEIEKPKGIDLK